MFYYSDNWLLVVELRDHLVNYHSPVLQKTQMLYYMYLGHASLSSLNSRSQMVTSSGLASMSCFHSDGKCIASTWQGFGGSFDECRRPGSLRQVLMRWWCCSATLPAVLFPVERQSGIVDSFVRGSQMFILCLGTSESDSLRQEFCPDGSRVDTCDGYIMPKLRSSVLVPSFVGTMV